MGLPGLLESPAVPLHMSPSFPLQLQLQRDDALSVLKSEYVQGASAADASAVVSAHAAPADDEQGTWRIENETKIERSPNHQLVKAASLCN